MVCWVNRGDIRKDHSHKGKLSQENQSFETDPEHYYSQRKVCRKNEGAFPCGFWAGDYTYPCLHAAGWSPSEHYKPLRLVGSFGANSLEFSKSEGRQGTQITLAPHLLQGARAVGCRDVWFCGGGMPVNVCPCVLKSVFARGILNNHMGPLI